MNTGYVYLFIDVFAIGIPLAFSFTSSTPLYRKWKILWPSLFITAVIFASCDVVLTATGVWGYNPAFIIGMCVYGVPIEAILYFVCLPYFGIYIYFALTRMIEHDYLYNHHELISSALSIVLMVTGIYHLDKAYTGLAFVGLGAFLAFQMIVLKPRYMSRFYFAFPVILIPVMLAELVRTGAFTTKAPVWYNQDETLDLFLGTVPVENIFYSLLLMVLSTTVYEWLRIKAGDYD